ncbi:MAG: hypothetical protein L6M37_00025 [Candidatus Methylarchaceae archaeon HK02M1]|nr:hypothetical protein [Candidatus Methylarchaceae archaeon HK02M1]
MTYVIKSLKETSTMTDDESVDFAKKVVSLFQSKRNMRVYPISKSVACVQFEDGEKFFVFDYINTKEEANQILTKMSKEHCDPIHIYG